jgi:gamma-D-glutamyl-L-lysine dipeptidyl-peptidase
LPRKQQGVFLITIHWYPAQLFWQIHEQASEKWANLPIFVTSYIKTNRSMPYAICHLSSAPIRKEASDASEIITQILFGETLEIVAISKQWRRVRCTWDGYEGWMDAKQITEIDELPSDSACSTALSGIVTMPYGSFPIVIGSNLPYFDGKFFQIGTKTGIFRQSVTFPQKNIANGDTIVRWAKRYLYAPYLWGGRSPFGIDCSGLTQVIFKMSGINLPRDAWQQAEIGQNIPLKDAKKGDLAFFTNDKGRVIHVGIMISPHKIIHASGCVRIDVLDEKGIFNVDRKEYSHTFALLKRYFVLT